MNKYFPSVLVAVVLSLGIIALGFLLKSGIENFKQMDRVVTVKGLSEKEVAADLVIWPIVYKVLDNNLENLYNTLESKNKVVVEFLKKGGIPESEISISAPNIIDAQAERYGNVEKPFRYNATGIVTVTSRNVPLVQKLIIEQVDLLKNGIAIVTDDYQYRTQYLFTGLNEIKPQMIADATANARLGAEKFAQDSGSRLGKIKQANQGQFSINDSNISTPQIKSVRVVTTIEYYLKD